MSIIKKKFTLLLVLILSSFSNVNAQELQEIGKYKDWKTTRKGCNSRAGKAKESICKRNPTHFSNRKTTAILWEAKVAQE